MIGAIGELDAYQLPDAKGFTALARYLLGINDAERQQYRDELLSTTVADFRHLGNILEALNNQASIVVLGSSENITKANQENQLFTETRKVL